MRPRSWQRGLPVRMRERRAYVSWHGVCGRSAIPTWLPHQWPPPCSEPMRPGIRTQAYASYYASVFHALRRELEVACSHAERCLVLSEEHGFGHWRNLASAVRWSCANLRDFATDSLATMHRELGGYAGAEYQLGITAIYVLLSAALAKRGELTSASEIISKGLATAERTSERIFEGELLRLQAQVLMADGAVDAAANAQVALEKALSIARGQHSRLLELRAARDLAALWRDQGKREAARDLLAPVYGWFTEGFDTLDLKEAKTLLDECAPDHQFRNGPDFVAAHEFETDACRTFVIDAAPFPKRIGFSDVRSSINGYYIG